MVEKRSNPELEWQDLTDIRADYLGVAETRDTVRKGAKIINEYIDAGWSLTAPSEATQEEDVTDKASFESKADGTCVSDRLIELCEGQELTPEILLQAHRLSPKEWKVVAYRNNYWHSRVKDGERLVMYQSRLSVKPYAEDEVSPASIKEWFEQFEPRPIQYSRITPEYGSGNNCLLLPVVDLHYNLLATKFITGNEYNCQIARDRFLSVIDDVIARACGRPLSKIFFPIGNDLFNANGISGATFKGTPQTNEKHIFEAYTELFQLMVFAITKLSALAPVDVVYIPSNHDKEVTFYFVHNLHTQFKNSEGRVSIDYSPIGNKYRKFGNTVMMFAHDAKMDKMGNLILDEAGDMLYGAKYIDAYLAHLHSETVRQDRNVTIRRLPTFSGKSAWTVENNYGSNSLCQSFIINDERNVTDILYTVA